MARIPTEEEWPILEEARLEELWPDVDATKDLAAFINELQAKAKARLNMSCRIRLVGAMAGFCSKSRLGPKDVAKAKRLEAILREVEELKRLQDRYGPAPTGANRSAANRECDGVHRNIVQHVAQLRSMAGYDVRTDERLAEAIAVTSEVMNELTPPLSDADCDGAMSILGALLANWVSATRSKKRQSFAQWKLSELVKVAGSVFQEATGRPPSARKSFMPFLECILDALPRGTYPKHEYESLVRRVRRVLLQRSAKEQTLPSS